MIAANCSEPTNSAAIQARNEPPEFVKSEKTREHDAADKIGGADQRLVAKRNRYVAPRQEAHDEAAPRAPRLTNRLRPDRQFSGPTMGLRFRSMPHAWRWPCSCLTPRLSRIATTIVNAACEPEIADVADCLNKMGARVVGAGTPRIMIEGVERLHGARHTVLPDRIEAGTYAMAVAMTGGDVQLAGARPELLQSALDVLQEAGAEISVNGDGIRVARNGAGIRPVTVSTAPFPGFPTDLQAQLMALMVRAQGASEITETIFENRFMHVQELARFGARISLDGETARIEGISALRGAPVMATDLRASVSLVIAGLAAEGETMVNRVYHLDRGFERLEEKLQACGASIERISD